MKDTSVEIQGWKCTYCGAARQWGTGAPVDPAATPVLECSCCEEKHPFVFVGLTPGTWVDFKQGAAA